PTLLRAYHPVYPELPDIRGGVCNDRGWARTRYVGVHLLRFPERIRVRPARLRLRYGMGDVHIYRHPHRDSASPAEEVGFLRMTAAIKTQTRAPNTQTHGPDKESRKRRHPRSGWSLARLLFMLALVVVFATPLLWMVNSSLRTEAAIAANPLGLAGPQLEFDNY